MRASHCGNDGVIMIAQHEVHAWLIPLDSVPNDRLRLLLSADERARADRFRRDRDRDRYIVGRGMLRTLLGRYLRADSSSLRFHYSPHGKPELPDAPLHFNLAHSHDLAVLAIAEHGPVGVDIEWLRGIRERDGIVGRFFSEPEQRVYEALPEALRLHAFFRGWTGKEAYLKAIGKGLAGPLEGVVIAIDPREPARLCGLAGDDVSRWTLRGFEPVPDYLGAVIVAGPIANLHLFHVGEI